MKALIINRAKDVKRFQFQEQQLIRLGIDFERIEAASVDNVESHVLEQQRGRWQRPLRDTEIACVLSHQKCWERIVELDEPCLILEDDAVLSESAPSILKGVRQVADSGYDLVSLEVRRRKKFLSKPIESVAENYTFHDMLYDKGGAAGYIVWPRGAQKLMRHMEMHGAAPADAFLGDCKNMKRGQVMPAAIIQLDMCAHYGLAQYADGLSTIFYKMERPPIEGLLNWVKFKTRRSLAQIDLFFRVQCMGRLSPRYQEVDVEIFKKDFAEVCE